MIVCQNCKFGVVGKYSKVYGGCPVGCNRPDDDRAYKHKGVKGCFVERSKKG